MNPINAMGLKVAGLTSVVMLLLGGLFFAGKYGINQYRQGPPAQLAQETIPETARTDSDGDNLPDQFEPVYRTDTTKADTDGDGVGDYDEITQGRDPAVAGSQDVIKPPTGSAVVDPVTYTQRYLASLPNDITREDILDKTRLEAFVNVNKGPLLPAQPTSPIQGTPASGKEAIKTYLDQISSTHNPALTNVTSDDIQQAFTVQLTDNGQALTTLTQQLEKNLTSLQPVAVPQEAAALHTKILLATEALLTNVRLLGTMKTDFVAGLVGSKNIEELGTIWQEIAAEVTALEVKYKLE